ncbi:cysteine and glycine-rich protein [Kwoniella heveanensis CBS 569]|uniref:Cysteine and glycine-rich protein n=1 Tax=Kwoniella heveanensis BCC8398 TaxID=1296120 RepID=A0A1B9GSQ1_9TREE|nr:cysteine and glycine-rich protein [Kwoniella heveanensis BCC8398]OCF40214.1 cysteine and glycine-rich protein [Kwoniella heveanensis CBS 569]
MAFGGAPKCENCGTSVYHAEQVLGPHRKIYHKLCLKCAQCGKRLDPGNLVEHDTQPYCARCHTQLFGTRDLRHANVLPNITPTSSPAKGTYSPNPPTPTYRLPSSVLSSAQSPQRSLPPPTEFYTPPRPRTPPPAEPATPTDPNTPITRPNFRDARPISVPYAGGAKALDDRGLLRKGESPRSKVGDRIAGDELCHGCDKRVYAAELVYSIGYKWHKACLRCTSCRSTLDPSRVSDNNGSPYCKNCYAKEHGPGGILGKR